MVKIGFFAVIIFLVLKIGRIARKSNSVIDEIDNRECLLKTMC